MFLLVLGFWMIPACLAVAAPLYVGFVVAAGRAGGRLPIYPPELPVRVTQVHLHGLAGYRGVDLSAGCDAPILSPIDGVVTFSGLDGYRHRDEFGRLYPESSMLTIDGGDVVVTLLHGRFTAEAGRRLRQGEVVGQEAAVGWASGCHTHVVMKQGGVEVNALDYLDVLPILVTYYDPRLGGMNCQEPCDRFGDMSSIKESDYYRPGQVTAAACVREWRYRLVHIQGLGTFRCRDTGGAIVRTARGIHVDILSAGPVCSDCTFWQWRLE